MKLILIDVLYASLFLNYHLIYVIILLYYKLLSFPLVLVGCSECYHLQLNGVVNPSIMYKDYTYTSGTSQTMNLYFKNFVCKFYTYINYI